MKFDKEKIKEYVIGLVKKWIWEFMIKTISKPFVFMAYTFPVISIISYIKKILSFLSLSSTVEEDIYQFVENFLLKYVINSGLQEAWGI